MWIQILGLAKDDLIEGFHFNERREKGVGVGFWKASIRTSRVLGPSADFIGNSLAGCIARSPRPFHSRSTIQLITNSFRSEQSRIAGGGHLRFDGTFEEPKRR
jgi:hypothetical protein